MNWLFEIDAPANGRVRTATILVRRERGGVELTDKADLTALAEREKTARRLAKRLELDADEVLRHLELGWAKAVEARFDAPRAQPPPAVHFAVHFSDQGNAQRLVACHGDDFRHCYPWKKDLVWTGRVWEIDNTGQVERWAKDTIRQMYAGAAREPDENRRARLAEHALWSEDAKRIHNMIALARSEPGVPVLPRQLDLDPWLLNVLNGTVDLRTGKLREHRRADSLTRLCPVDYDPAAVCPLWEWFLCGTFPATGDAAEAPGDRELIRYLQRYLGYCLSGNVSEQILAIFWGKGANGKSTLLTLLLELLGMDYAIKAAPDLLLTKKEAHPTEKADLFGRRLVAAIETEEGGRLAEALVKDLTGGDRIRARRMREDFWEFSPTHKLILCTNHKPKIRGTDHAIWRRLRLFPFTVTIPDEQQDKQLLDKLRAERKGVLAWLVRGCLDWQREGLGLPEAVRAATEGYRSEQDLLAGFIEECCITGSSSYRCRAGELYGRFRAWCEASGEAKGSEVPSQRKVGEALTERGFERRTSNGTWYLGIGLRQEPCGELRD
jgi:putative DNA primase/helicase